MNSPLLFNPSMPEWGKFLFTGNMGFFLLAGIPLFWLGRRQENWLFMGCGILALASSSIFTCLERVEISLLRIRNLQDSWRILPERSF
jgi:hypothetical protein